MRPRCTVTKRVCNGELVSLQHSQPTRKRKAEMHATLTKPGFCRFSTIIRHAPVILGIGYRRSVPESTDLGTLVLEISGILSPILVSFCFEFNMTTPRYTRRSLVRAPQGMHLRPKVISPNFCSSSPQWYKGPNRLDVTSEMLQFPCL